MAGRSQLLIWLFALWMVSGWHSAARAQDIESIQLTLRSRICPPETSRISLVNGSCKPEAARLAAARSGESNPAYADLMACNRRETEQNRAILQYNQFMETCESSERSKQEAERKKAAEEARAKAQETKAAASKASPSTQDIDKRLEQAKLKAETLGRKNQDQGRSLASKAQEVAQAKFLEHTKESTEKLLHTRPKGDPNTFCAQRFKSWHYQYYLRGSLSYDEVVGRWKSYVNNRWDPDCDMLDNKAFPF